MENIFEGVKFGDKFVNKHNDIFIFQKFEEGLAHLFNDNVDINVELDGQYADGYIENNIWDIISKYQEPIDEEKLDELAKSIYNSNVSNNEFLYQIQLAEINGFKAGYRKAMEE